MVKADNKNDIRIRSEKMKKEETKDIPDVVAETKLSSASLHLYVYSLLVSTLCSGCLHMHELESNVEAFRNMKKLSETDKQTQIEYAKPYSGQIVENYKRVLK